MANPRRFELEDLVIRPGTYFNPQTEVLLVVDDSPEIDNEMLELEEVDGAEWVLVSDESPIDETVRDELLERFQIAHAGAESLLGSDEEGEDEEDEELEPDEEAELE
ncbi:MAG: hypothetical protein ACYCSI_14305 [Solirubrobacteraceae bacterium]